MIEINTEDLESFFDKEDDAFLLSSILHNTKRYLSLFYQAVDKIDLKPSKKLQPEDMIDNAEDIITSQRLQNIEAAKQTGKSFIESKQQLPKELTRNFDLVIVPGPGSKDNTKPMRSLRAEEIGSLVTVKGIVVRVTDVKPFLRVACYSCDICGHENYQIISGRTYMPLVDCTSEQCKNNRTHGKISMNNRNSKFVSYQEIKIQEPTHEVPVGHCPRSITILAFNQCTRKCSPGDLVSITGVFLPSMITNTRIHRSRLIHDTYIEAFQITREKKTYQESTLPPDFFDKLRKNTHIYEDLSRSIAPEIFGMDDIKKALLLLLVGGVDKEMQDGMKIRGNLNILLMGDPGIAKSQLLKYISNISPRGVYTTGKGSSGVGLTAAVVKDPITNDLVLEGGALVLADMGVCCIDEFDKMSDYDRANIHEVMEQQTVSIAKAGITTRLNARASVLAAANPLYGRYNEKLSPHENINLPAALLSRFDLIFLLLDKPNKEKDLELAKHVTYVHQNSKAPKFEKEVYEPNIIRSYIAQAKAMEPTIPKDLHTFIIQKYVEKRKQESESTKQGYQYITPRSLLAIIRLAQALAKLRMGDKVSQDDVDEALRLVEVSKSSVDTSDEKGEMNIPTQKTDAKSQAFKVIRELCSKAKDKTVKMTLIERKLFPKFSKKLLQTVLEEYVNLSILYVDVNGTEVTLL